MQIYADNAATTKMSRTAIDAMLPYMKPITETPPACTPLASRRRRR